MRFADGGTGTPKGDARRVAALPPTVRREVRRIFSVSPEPADDPPGSTYLVKRPASHPPGPVNDERCPASHPPGPANDERCPASHPPGPANDERCPASHPPEPANDERCPASRPPGPANDERCPASRPPGPANDKRCPASHPPGISRPRKRFPADTLRRPRKGGEGGDKLQYRSFKASYVGKGLVTSPAPEGRPLNSLGWKPQVWASPIRRAPKGRPTAEVSAGPSGLGELSACQPGAEAPGCSKFAPTGRGRGQAPPLRKTP